VPITVSRQRHLPLRQLLLTAFSADPAFADVEPRMKAMEQALIGMDPSAFANLQGEVEAELRMEDEEARRARKARRSRKARKGAAADQATADPK
jgi:hypothetical protein